MLFSKFSEPSMPHGFAPTVLPSFRSCFLAPKSSAFRRAIEAIPDCDAVRRKRNVYGVRNLLDLSPDVRRLAALPEVRQLVTPIIGEGAFAARAIFFDKVPGANWALGWHQDSVIAVAEQQDVPGFLAWGQKAGVWQVQPPPEILAAMVAVRIHLDDCGPDNGPLRVIPGSHRHGWLDNEISRWKETVGAGDVPRAGRRRGRDVPADPPRLLESSLAQPSPRDSYRVRE